MTRMITRIATTTDPASARGLFAACVQCYPVLPHHPVRVLLATAVQAAGAPCAIFFTAEQLAGQTATEVNQPVARSLKTAVPFPEAIRIRTDKAPGGAP
jgi:hypothetical protein